MRLSGWLCTALASASFLLIPVLAQEGQETFEYESDISRLRSIVINSLYSQKDVFLRELLSNANDALEKLRITALKDHHVTNGGEGNITIAVELEEGSEGKRGKLIIRDTGIGMTKTELARNLGTIARSGTSDFLKTADNENGAAADGNLIGQFGLGFYSCFLVSPTVEVSSLPPPTPENPDPIQHTFFSAASGSSFTVQPDPRGNTLGRGTEIVLNIGEEDMNFLSTTQLKDLVEKHSQYSTTFPIYIKQRVSRKVPKTKDEDLFENEHADLESTLKEEELQEIWEENWIRLNDRAPLWMRDAKDVTETEYREFYKAVAKEPNAETIGWSHFKGDTQSGVSFRSIIYIPSSLPDDFWSKATSGFNNVRLMVKRVFITDDLGEEYMPRWLSFLKITVDADDLPLNVSRETLQNNRFLKQLQRILVRKALDLFTKIAETDPEGFKTVSKYYGNALRIGLMESAKDKIKIAKLLRFESTRTNYTSLDEYVENRKVGQTQIYFLAGVGDKPETLKRSPFVEKLIARGYEVLLLNLPSDEVMMGALSNYAGMTTQDVSKKGLKYGDEAEDEAEFQAQKKGFKPLIEWLKTELAGRVSDVVLTNRLVTSPCTIVVEHMGWSANMAKIMAAQATSEDDPMFKMMRDLPKVLEINPKSPLIEGLLERVLDLGDDHSSTEALEISETVQVLFDTSLVRSGFTVSDSDTYFTRVEALLRRSLGVSLSAKTSSVVRAAPPVAVGPLDEQGTDRDASDEGEGESTGDSVNWEDWLSIKDKMRGEAADNDVVHDEL